MSKYMIEVKYTGSNAMKIRDTLLHKVSPEKIGTLKSNVEKLSMIIFETDIEIVYNLNNKIIRLCYNYLKKDIYADCKVIVYEIHNKDKIIARYVNNSSNLIESWLYYLTEKGIIVNKKTIR